MHDARDLRKASYGYLRFPGVGCAAQKGGETQQNRAARQAVDCSAGCVHLTRLKSALKPAAYTSSQTVTLTAVQHHLHLHPHHPWVRAHTCTSTCSTHSPAVRRLQQQRRSHPPFPLYPSQPCSLTISGMVLSSRWISSRPGITFCPWPLPRVCEADDDGDDWGLLSCHR